MNFKEWLLQEMPIGNFGMIGAWDKGPDKKRYGYKSDDIRLLTNPVAVDKIHKKWSNTKETFDFYFVRTPEGKKYLEYGEVTPEWVKKNLMLDITPRPDTITVIFTNNIGQERIPMTAWAIAHRFGHAIKNMPHFKDFEREVQSYFNTIFRSAYNFEPRRAYGYSDQDNRRRQDTETMSRHLAHGIGTMKSARDRKIVNSNEFLYELLAQYLITGHIKLNTPPPKLGSSAFGRRALHANPDELEQWDDYSMAGIAETLEQYLDAAVGSLVNKVFVM